MPDRKKTPTHHAEDDLPSDGFYMRDSRSRYFPQAPAILPLTVRAAGHYRMKKANWKYPIRSRPVNQLFWIREGKVSFERNGVKKIYGEGTVAVYYPYEPHIIAAVSEIIDFYWLTLHGNLADMLFRRFGFPDIPVHCGRCPVHLFDTLMEQVCNDSTPFGLANAASTAMMILNFAKTGIPEEHLQNHLVQQAVLYMENHYSDPQLNVNALADLLKINRSVLSREFKKRMDMSPLNYLMLTRLYHASGMLQSSDLPIKKISRLAGFSNQISFIRAFERHFQKTPTEYRLDWI